MIFFPQSLDDVTPLASVVASSFVLPFFFFFFLTPWLLYLLFGHDTVFSLDIVHIGMHLFIYPACDTLQFIFINTLFSPFGNPISRL